MEALVFRYFATAAGSLWAWAAVLAAALSLWRLRSFNTKPNTSSPSPHLPPPTPPPAQPPFFVPEPPSTSVSDGLTKGTFIAYFHNNDYSGGDDDDVDGECDVANRQWPALRRSDTVAVRRSGVIPMGWYRYQDRSVINGSVVRLWEGEPAFSSAVMG